MAPELIAVTWLAVSRLILGTLSGDLLRTCVDPLSSFDVSQPSQRASCTHRAPEHLIERLILLVDHHDVLDRTTCCDPQGGLRGRGDRGSTHQSTRDEGAGSETHRCASRHASEKLRRTRSSHGGR